MHRWESADFGWSPLAAEADETASAPEKAGAKTYLMIQADPPRVHQVFEEVRPLETVAKAHEVTGSFDIVALIEADRAAALPALLCRAISTMPGVWAAALVVSTTAP